jgi:transcriptional regulator with XRE-family HTH domain
METRLSGDAFGLVLRRRRTAARLTQEQLAATAGLSARAVADIERGRVRYPRPESARLLGCALGLDGPALNAFVVLARAEYWACRERRESTWDGLGALFTAEAVEAVRGVGIDISGQFPGSAAGRGGEQDGGEQRGDRERDDRGREAVRR